jgi:hypothetical protein
VGEEAEMSCEQLGAFFASQKTQALRGWLKPLRGLSMEFCSAKLRKQLPHRSNCSICGQMFYFLAKILDFFL